MSLLYSPSANAHAPLFLNASSIPIPTLTKPHFAPPPSHHLLYFSSIRNRSSFVLRFSSLSDMETTADQGLYPLHRTKTVHLVRHAQGIHNVEGEKDFSAYLSEALFDAHLTPLGWQQGVHPCDRRRSISEYKPLFPAIDFSLIENDTDVLWTADVREKNEEVAARGQKFLNWLWSRKEKEIAVVTHSGFLYHTLSAFGNDCHPSVKSEICTHFKNCELRSVVIIDRSMMGSDPATTNYSGKIPSGLDLPSDVAQEKHPEIGSV
ncbi:phosphoglycerate mutase-like protein 1 isoform X2 [Manihot esculenta]|uniref:phosphoglycerate mutase-like protein 1 isoform X2 n=1 Tax=Manihot esculenta TaxID=3983 RepID=UPI001CC3AFB8|nr:phosphoglycerate mutase-like protein 1 isoform X2 [Manihot esculenta]